ncbi:MAG: hypothetical protein HQ515_04205 [Phycisphaeraceae bacterium]|nr:hypothetical protein [Phycisphaeraceae bacterium]
MSHSNTPWHKGQLFVCVGFWSVVLVAAFWWLTVFLLGTLGDTFAKSGPPLSAIDSIDSVVALTEKKVVRYLGEWELQEPKLSGHFHHVGQWYQADTQNFCIKCHGAAPHSRSPQLRAFLNMHNLFMSCQVCHAREEIETPATRFGWLDLESNELCPNPDMEQGVWGEYGAKIVPLIGSKDKPEPLILVEEAAFTTDFRKRIDGLNDSQKAKGNKVIHRRCVDVPVRCYDCHNTQDAFLPYTQLGYSEDRAAFLVSAEVADLVERYETFYLPNLLNTRESSETQTEDPVQ